MQCDASKKDNRKYALTKYIISQLLNHLAMNLKPHSIISTVYYPCLSS